MCFSCNAATFVDDMPPETVAHVLMTMVFKMRPDRIHEAIAAAENIPLHISPLQRNLEEEQARRFVADLLRAVAVMRPQFITLAKRHGIPCPSDEPPQTGAAPTGESLAEMFGLTRPKKGHLLK